MHGEIKFGRVVHTFSCVQGRAAVCAMFNLNAIMDTVIGVTCLKISHQEYELFNIMIRAERKKFRLSLTQLE